MTEDRSRPARAEALPDITRPDIDIIAVRQWEVTSPAE